MAWAVRGFYSLPDETKQNYDSYYSSIPDAENKKKNLTSSERAVEYN